MEVQVLPDQTVKSEKWYFKFRSCKISMYCFFSSPLLSQTVTVNLCIGFILGRDMVTVKEKVQRIY